MSLSPTPIPQRARVVPIHAQSAVAWQGDLLTFLTSNPRHMAWLTRRPVICHFVDEVLLAQMIHARAEEVAIYHNPWRFEVDFRVRGRRHQINVRNQRWALPVVLRLMELAGMDLRNHEAWQVGELQLDDDLHVNVWHYPTSRSERIVMRPRWRETMTGGPVTALALSVA